MGLIKPSSKEKQLLRKMFIDAAGHIGEECSITLYQNYEEGDLSSTKSNPILLETGVIFEEYPEPRLLKSFNWYNEDENKLPSIVYIPSEYNDQELFVREGSKLTVHFGSVDNDYRISSVRGRMGGSVYYVCKLTPWFDSEDTNDIDPTFDSERHDKKYKYFNVDKEDVIDI